MQTKAPFGAAFFGGEATADMFLLVFASYSTVPSCCNCAD